MRTTLKRTFLTVPLAGVLITALSACTPHERLHYGLEGEHEAFHATPHTSAEHRGLHEDLEDTHRGAHDRDGYQDRDYGDYRY